MPVMAVLPVMKVLAVLTIWQYGWTDSTDSIKGTSNRHHCTMSQTFQKFIKEEKILYARLWIENVHHFCKWCKTAKILTYVSSLNFLMHFWCFSWRKKTRRGSHKVELLVTFICKKKFKIMPLGWNRFKVWKMNKTNKISLVTLWLLSFIFYLLVRVSFS